VDLDGIEIGHLLLSGHGDIDGVYSKDRHIAGVLYEIGRLAGPVVAATRCAVPEDRRQP
jgi:hypothetical protein